MIFLKRFYCPQCKRFKSRFEVKFHESFYEVPYYYCKGCHTEVVETADILHRLVKGIIDSSTEEVENNA